ncbi:DUF4870 domain-containing protein [Nocardiopsis salina]|uniref:DUF4870 domain-containing protein n=1 Tax=Nocardiopsis salina TaxID=245836 RepID=UPI001872B369|nr:DUF4870 domain-containing protein [Nocardiopsis salina]
MSYPNPPGGPDGQGWQHGGMPPQGDPSGGYPPPAQAPGGHPPQHTGGQPPHPSGYGPPPPAPGGHPGAQGMPPAGPPQGGPPVPYHDPYAQQGQGWGNPYAQQGQAWGDPYAQQGQGWGDPYAQQQGMYGHGHPTPAECDSAKVVHIGGIFGVMVALIMYLMKKDESPYVRYHAAQALNFQLLMMIGYFISGLLFIIVIGVFTWIALLITSIVLQIKAAGAAGRGEWHRFPFNVSWVS